MKIYLTLFLFFCCTLNGENTLNQNLTRSRKGDYVITAQNKNFTLLSINDKDDRTLTLEEITIPANRVSKNGHNWKEWVRQNAPGHTSWVMYAIDIPTGKVTHFYSFSKKCWFDVSKVDNFLSKLLTLELSEIPSNMRKKIGAPPGPGGRDMRQLWQPKMVYEGQEIKNVEFQAWRTRWPKDGSPLTNKPIEVYILKENDSYPTYFPYWLQVAGMVGPAKIRIVDSGSSLHSEKKLSLTKG